MLQQPLKFIMASGDTSLWLHNKLGSTDDLWSGKTICSHLSREKIQNIQACFQTLQPHVKVKLMLSFLHNVRRNVEEWKEDLEEILLMAAHDTDQWVSTIAELLRTFPDTGALNLDLDDNRTFIDVLTDLKRLVKKATDIHMLPLECNFLNRNALVSIAGQQPNPIKHFSLKRKPKSAALRAELLQKSSEISNNRKTIGGNNSFPMKVRSFAKKMDDDSPMKGLPNRTMSTSLGFLPATPGIGRLNSNPLLGSGLSSHRNAFSRKEGGIKLLDIAEQPVGAKEAKRRRKQAEMEAMEQLRKEKEVAEAALAEAGTPSYAPDYAAGLVASSVPTKLGVPGVSSSSSDPFSNTGPSYTPSATVRLPGESIASNLVTTTSSADASLLASAVTQQARDNLQQQLQHQLSQPELKSATTTTPATTVIMRPTVNNKPQTTVIVRPPMPALVRGVNPLIQPVATGVPKPVVQPRLPVLQPAEKKDLSLTKLQMSKAQQMFLQSNRVTRPEKALILGFMAGSRENPCPQQGDVLSILLNEAQEVVVQMDGSRKTMAAQTFFQMNYATGEWKRFKEFHEIIVPIVPDVT